MRNNPVFLWFKGQNRTHTTTREHVEFYLGQAKLGNQKLKKTARNIGGFTPTSHYFNNGNFRKYLWKFVTNWKNVVMCYLKHHIEARCFQFSQNYQTHIVLYAPSGVISNRTRALPCRGFMSGSDTSVRHFHHPTWLYHSETDKPTQSHNNNETGFSSLNLIPFPISPGFVSVKSLS